MSTVKAPAQSASKLDTLLDALRHPFENDSLKAIAYEDVIWYYIEQADEPQVQIYLDSLRLFGVDQHYGYAELLYEFNVSYLYFRKSEYDTATWHMERVVVLSDSLNYPKQKFNALSRLATITKVTGDLDASMIYLREATQIAEELQIPKLVARALLQKAMVSYDIGDYMTALEDYIRVDSLYQELEEVSPYERGIVYNNLGILQHEQIGDDEKALEYLEKAREFFVKHGVKHHLATLDHTLARVYFKQNRMKEADSLLESALDYFRAINHPLLIAKSAMLLGDVKLQLHQNARGESLLLEALSKYEELGSPVSLVTVHVKLGGYYAEKGRFSLSQQHLQKALHLDPPAETRAEILRSMANSLRMSGEYKSAVDTLSSYLVLSDSLNAQELQQALQEVEMRYQTSEKEREIVNLKLIQGAQELRNQRLFFLSALGISVLLFLSYFYFIRSDYTLNSVCFKVGRNPYQ